MLMLQIWFRDFGMFVTLFLCYFLTIFALYSKRPFSAAIAERLWSDKSINDVSKAEPRMHNHECRLVKRNIRTQPANGPSFCVDEYAYTYSAPYHAQSDVQLL
jgi:hypothetical protein